MTVRDFKKFFKRRGRLVRQPWNDKKTFQRSQDDKNSKSDRKCFRCGDPNHLIRECPKPPKDKNRRAFVVDLGMYPSKSTVGELAADSGCSSAGSISSFGGINYGYSGSGTNSGRGGCSGPDT
nr:retrovirus-related Pol polyprotein from transposon TNT 1-94 [Tanacetum cinerariifolium]